MIDIVDADFSLPAHGTATIELMRYYALDPMGGGQALSRHAQENLIHELRIRSSIHGVLAFADKDPAGLIIYIEGFSTFACQPLINIHDVIVRQQHRGQGIAKRMLQRVEAIAQEMGCCKLTLEVLENNYVAQAAYRSFGFHGYELNPKMGKALFWEKKLHRIPN